MQEIKHEIDLALGHYTSAYDIDFLYNLSDRYGSTLATIGRLIDKCSDFKDLKNYLGDDKERQIKAIVTIQQLYDGVDIDGMNLWDTVEYYWDNIKDF